MQKLQNKVAIITGGNSGIGLATAQRFAREGAYIYLVGRRAGELEKAKSSLDAPATAVQADVTKLADLDRLYEIVAREKGVIDIVVANAGLVERKAIEKVTPEHFDKTFELNARGTFFTAQKAIPLMKRGGSIVFVASAVQLKGFPEYAVYTATKAAIRSYSRTFAMELKNRGIRANTLSPGVIETPMVEGLATSKAEVDTIKAMFTSNAPLGRLGRPEEMAAAALFLASDDSSYCTGIDLVADGGGTQV